MGKGYSPLYVRDKETGLEIRDENNQRVPDTDFRRVCQGFDEFSGAVKWEKTERRLDKWPGARISDILNHATLDMKPRRLMPRALANIRGIKSGQHAILSDIADVVEDTIDILEGDGAAKFWRLVEGLDIGAVEGTVTPQGIARAWEIAERKTRTVYKLQKRDIIIGLVRPERRNIGLLLDDDDNIVGSTDGIAVVRVKPSMKEKFPQEWLFAALRSEACRLQFWTESGGTSYGELTRDHVENIVVPIPPENAVVTTASRVRSWSIATQKAIAARNEIGEPADRTPIVNSPGYGLLEDGDDNTELESISDLEDNSRSLVPSKDGRKTFRDLMTEWKKTRGHSSKIKDLAVNLAYRRIIGMGETAVPLILEEMRHHPDQWTWALRAITGADPVPKESRGKLKEMAAAWLAWGIAEGYIE
jgi:type I restriction enzyme M protein